MARANKRASAPGESRDDSQHDMVEEHEQRGSNRGGRRSQVLVPPGVEAAMQVRAGAAQRGRTKVIHANPLRVGKDEMNLIEHPFAALWQKEPGDSVIFYQWTAHHPDTGRELPASWMVAGSAEFGLPTPSDERVYLVLMELTREAGFEEPRVYFSRYDIIQRLGWPNTAQYYRMLQGAFDRLKGVVISAKNAFWNLKTRSYRNTAFNILDMYDINAEALGRKSARSLELPLSYFEWSEVMFDSFQGGYIRTLDLDFALSLSGDIALRLYRYLDKKAYDGRASFEIDLFSLCIGHLGMKPSPYASKLKERLARPHDELVAKGFLRAVSFESGKANKSVKVRYLFTKRPVSLDAPVPLALGALNPAPAALEAQPTLPLAEGTLPQAPPEAVATPAPEEFTPPERELLARMEAIRVSPEAARELVRKLPPEALQVQLDCLDDREPRDRAATFVKSVREMWALPEKYVERKDAQERAEKARAAQESARAQKAAQKAAEGLQRASAQEDEARLDAVWEKLDPADREKLESQARERLGVLGLTGRAQGALVAMRRNLLRQKLGEVEG